VVVIVAAKFGPTKTLYKRYVQITLENFVGVLTAEDYIFARKYLCVVIIYIRLYIEVLNYDR